MPTTRIGSTMYFIAIAGFIALLAMLFGHRLDQWRNPNQRIESMTAPDGAARIVLQRNRYGHYLATGTLNGVPAEFIVDTGATDVAVSQDVAKAAGLPQGTPLAVMTANGMTTAYATRIDELRLGGIAERDVAATIVPNMGAIEVLLGMSFLARLDFTQRGDSLILTSRRAPAAAPALP